MFAAARRELGHGASMVQLRGNLRMSFSLVIDVSTPKAQRTRKLESLLEHSHAISVKIRKFSLN